MGKKKAKDHYVSRTYLKHFLNDSNKVWVYDKKNLKIRERGRAEICWTGNGSSNPYLSKSRVVEDYLKVFENQWNDALLIFSSQESITLEEYSKAKYIISGYVAYLRFGTPAAIRAGTKTLEPTLYASIEMLSRQGLLPKPPEGFEYLLDDIRKKLKFEINKKYPQALGINAMGGACETFYQSPWAIFDNNTGTPFLTSDNPTCIWKPGPSSPNMIYVPLTPTLAILINSCASKISQENEFDPEMEIRNFAKEEFVTEINQKVIKHSEQYVISNHQSLQILKLVKELKDWKYECKTTEIPTEKGRCIVNSLGASLR